MHPELIKAHLRMKGVTPALLAERLGKSRSCITQVIAARTKTPEIQQAIAAVLGLPVSDIWPGQIRLRREKNASPVHERAGLKPAPVMNSTH